MALLHNMVYRHDGATRGHNGRRALQCTPEPKRSGRPA